MLVTRRCLLAFVFALPSLCGAEESSSELTRRFQDWAVRTHAGTFDPLSIPDLEEVPCLDHYLLSRGPSVVPLIVDALRQSRTGSYIEPLLRIFRYCSRAVLFSATVITSNIDIKWGILPLSEAGGIPALRNDAGYSFITVDEPYEMRDVILAWWERAPTILTSPAAMDDVLALPLNEDLVELEKRFSGPARREPYNAGGGSSATTALGEDDGVDEEQNRVWIRLWRIGWYGIYNLPRFIDVIAQGENGLVFFQLAAILNIWWDELDGGGNFRINWISGAKTMTGRFPTREDRIAVICRWWRAKHEDFRALPDLYDAIDKRLRTLCPEVEEKMKDSEQRSPERQ